MTSCTQCPGNASLCPGGTAKPLTSAQIDSIRQQQGPNDGTILEASDGTLQDDSGEAKSISDHVFVPLMCVLLTLMALPIIFHAYIPESVFMKLDITAQGHKVHVAHIL